MSFHFDFSFSLSFSLGQQRADDAHDGILAIGSPSIRLGQDGSDIALSAVPQAQTDLDPVFDTSVAPSTPIRPILPRFSAYHRGKDIVPDRPVIKTGDTPATNILSAESNTSDHASLATLLKHCSQQSTIAAVVEDECSDPAPDRHTQYTPLASPNDSAEDSCTSSPKLALGDDVGSDFGSDLESSLRRVRLGVLSSYLLEQDRLASLPSSSSPTTAVSVDGDLHFSRMKEEKQLMSISMADYADWEVMTVREAEDE